MTILDSLAAYIARVAMPYHVGPFMRYTFKAPDND